MARQWVNELKEKEAVDESYLVVRKNLLFAKNGKPYLNLVLTDKSGRVEGRVWDHADEMNNQFAEGDVIAVKARATRYQDRMQLKITAIQRLAETHYDLSELIPSTTRSVAKMWQELTALADSVKTPHLKILLNDILADAEVAAKLKQAPAAKSIHHARAGGLLEHTLSVCGLLEKIWAHYEKLYPGYMNRDLLIAGGILHDLGKAWELLPPTFTYSDAGRLVGHIVMVHQMVSERIQKIPQFPETLSLHLQHILLAHHGELDYGSPKRPKTAEAWAVHYADILDGRLEWLHEQVAPLEPGGWTGYQRLHDRYFWSPPTPPTDPPSNDPPSNDPPSNDPLQSIPQPHHTDSVQPEKETQTAQNKTQQTAQQDQQDLFPWK